MQKNKKIVWGVVGVIVMVAVFYGGVAYGKGHAPAPARRGTGATAFTGGAAGGRGGAAGGFGGFTTGSIISKDDKSITVSIMGGGSKIIFLDTNTKIYKQTDGTTSDLATGTQVSVMGTPNSDGSVNATSVQIRPNMPASAKVQ